MIALVFTTTTADAMARQCANFIKEYCNQLNGKCNQCTFGKHCGEQDICCPLTRLPDTWEISEDKE